MAENNNDGFTINVNSPGNFIARDITFTGPVNIGNGSTDCGGFSDEQIAQAIKAICGKGKPLNSKKRWAGVFWCLRWYCNFPPTAKEFCERVAKLPLGKLDFECDYGCIRHDCTLSFMDENARYIDKARYSNMDTDIFMQCREVVLALAAELGKAALPKIKI
jgi:hypothetical protein